MCGIAGLVVPAGEAGGAKALGRMRAVLAHRGPDGDGAWSGVEGKAEVLLGHRRLAILDLSERGRQPFVSPCGRHVLVYNGEVYNYLELRRELAGLGTAFSSDCDTEVVLQSLMRWGEEALSRFNGMWALAWLDRRAGSLFLARDRFGVKPLYYCRAKDRLTFSSEIKAILEADGERRSVDPLAAGRFLRQSLLDAQPQTFFSGILAFPAGHYARLDLRRGAVTGLDPRPYWSAPVRDAFEGCESRRVEALRETFLSAVRLRLRSDVPVGVLLSGGLDSSCIAAAMRAELGREAPLHAFSAVGGPPGSGEEPFMDLMCSHLACESRRIRVSAEQAFDALPAAIYFNDEPVGGLNTAAYRLLMEEARRSGVTVLLTGQGADELLCGYKKYLAFHLQALLRDGRVGAAARTALPFARRGTVLSQFDFREARRYLPRWLRPSVPDVRGPALRDFSDELPLGLGRGSLAERQRMDLEVASLPALLHYEDRMSMASSREMRVPFLDYRLVSLLLPSPAETKLRDGWTKWLLRKAMEPYLPPEAAWRRDKRHFALPQARWLKHDLRDRVRAILGGELLTARSGLVDQGCLKKLYETFCAQPEEGGDIWFKDVFNPLALELWMRAFSRNLAG